MTQSLSPVTLDRDSFKIFADRIRTLREIAGKSMVICIKLTEQSLF